MKMIKGAIEVEKRDSKKRNSDRGQKGAATKIQTCIRKCLLTVKTAALGKDCKTLRWSLLLTFQCYSGQDSAYFIYFICFALCIMIVSGDVALLGAIEASDDDLSKLST